jgi:hypothetical protein
MNALPRKFVDLSRKADEVVYQAEIVKSKIDELLDMIRGDEDIDIEMWKEEVLVEIDVLGDNIGTLEQHLEVL